MSDNDLTGYVQNVQDVNANSFSFELQLSPTQSRRFVCYTPTKKQKIEEKLQSPVKLKNVKLGNTQNFFNNNSEVEDAAADTLDFTPINYENLTISQIKAVSTNALININVQVIKKSYSTVKNDKNVDVYEVHDPTGNYNMIVPFI